jgi:hypothetical protein
MRGRRGVLPGIRGLLLGSGRARRRVDQPAARLEARRDRIAVLDAAIVPVGRARARGGSAAREARGLQPVRRPGERLRGRVRRGTLEGRGGVPAWIPGWLARPWSAGWQSVDLPPARLERPRERAGVRGAAIVLVGRARVRAWASRCGRRVRVDESRYFMWRAARSASSSLVSVVDRSRVPLDWTGLGRRRHRRGERLRRVNRPPAADAGRPGLRAVDVSPRRDRGSVEVQLRLEAPARNRCERRDLARLARDQAAEEPAQACSWSR